MKITEIILTISNILIKGPDSPTFLAQQRIETKSSRERRIGGEKHGNG